MTSSDRIDAAIKTLVDKERKHNTRSPEREALYDISTSLGDKYVERVGPGLDDKTAKADSELQKDYQWAAEQYFLLRLDKLRNQQ